MTGLVDWAAQRARMVLAFILLSITAGYVSYTGLPKEGAPDIDIPVLFVSVPYPGISAEDSERLLVQPMESRLSDVSGLKRMTATASEGYAGIALEFDFDWDRNATRADVQDKVSQAESLLPDGVGTISINEINFSEFPIVIIALSGNVPERTLLRAARDLQGDVEGVSGVLEAGLSGVRDEMLEVIIDPLKLEAYNVTAGELIAVVNNNNRLIAAGEVEVGSGAYSIKIPSAFDDPMDVYNLPVKTNGDRVVTLGDIAEIRLTFEDRQGTARFNGEDTVALQVVMRKGANLIDTVAAVRAQVDASLAAWPEEMRSAVEVNFSLDNSQQVQGMVDQLLASVLTAIALVMITVLASLGIRSALLVGFAIPTSFLLTFAFLSVLGISISNIVMFGLILAVGMLVDGAIVVVEYADKTIRQGVGPMRAYATAAKRMFWPIVSSTATTLCAFLPFLFWPGVAGQFMGNLPVTIIIVLSASIIVALIYLPVVGGVTGRLSRMFERAANGLRNRLHWSLRLGLVLLMTGTMFAALMAIIGGNPGALLLLALAMPGLSMTVASLRRRGRDPVGKAGYRRSPFGWFIHFIAGNPIMPLVVLAFVAVFVVTVFRIYGENGKGFEFFVETEPERAVAYVRARGNLSLAEKDRLVRQAEDAIMAVDGVQYVFAFAGETGLNTNNGGAAVPIDAIGSIQIELAPWGERGPGKEILDEVDAALAAIPGIQANIVDQNMGPASASAIVLRITGSSWDELLETTGYIRDHMETDTTIIDIADTRPLPGIDWQIDVNVEQAGRFGTDVVTVGGMIQLVTRGLTLGTMRTDTSDEEIDIRVRFPEEDRLLSTLDTLRVRTPQALVPLSNFVTRQPVPKLGEITRIDQERYLLITANVTEGTNPNDAIATLTTWLTDEATLPTSIGWEFTGDTEEQNETAQFLMFGFAGALALMFIILLTQFNSIYFSALILLAVMLSTVGVLIGMLVMEQTFSFIMTGTGIVALAGIVVNNNIVLIDTFQEYRRYMPTVQAIVRTAEDRIRPVLLTTITTMAGLMPMMLGLSFDFLGGGYTVDAPTALWWKQLATAVVFGLGIATVLTLVVTPSMLSLQYWLGRLLKEGWGALRRGAASGEDDVVADARLRRTARRLDDTSIIWTDQPIPAATPKMVKPAAE